jgi:hypothetical protein
VRFPAWRRPIGMAGTVAAHADSWKIFPCLA